MLVCTHVRLPLPDPRRHPRDADRRGREAGPARPMTAVDLDDVEALRALDAGDMLGAVASLPRHAGTGYDAGRVDRCGLPLADGVDRRGVLRHGRLGGRRRRAARDLPRPPHRAGRGQPLARCCRRTSGRTRSWSCSSYSGSTAETLVVLRGGRGPRRAASCRSPRAARSPARADELGLAAVRIPGGYQPRAALGLPRLRAARARCERSACCPTLADDVDDAIGVLEPLVEALGPDGARRAQRGEGARARGSAIAQPVDLGRRRRRRRLRRMRWKTQMNENGKVPAWAAALPELDHNEVVGWSERRGDGVVRDRAARRARAPDVSVRFPISLEIAREAGAGDRRGRGRRDAIRLARFLLARDHGRLRELLRRASRRASTRRRSRRSCD